jgi:prepilin-type N-terminal cleavage/methylation domain-containing protein
MRFSSFVCSALGAVAWSFFGRLFRDCQDYSCHFFGWAYNSGVRSYPFGFSFQLFSLLKLRRRCNAGFSLLELLVVLFIFGVLVMVAFPHIDVAMQRSREIKCESRLEMIKRAKSAYVVDNVASRRVFSGLDLSQLAPTDAQQQQALFRMYFMEPFPFTCPASPLEEPSPYVDVYHLYKDAACPFCSQTQQGGGL